MDRSRERRGFSLFSYVALGVAMVGLAGSADETWNCNMPKTMYGKPFEHSNHVRLVPEGIHWRDLQGSIMGESNIVDDLRPADPQLAEGRVVFVTPGSLDPVEWLDELPENKLPVRYCYALKKDTKIGGFRKKLFTEVPATAWTLDGEYHKNGIQD